MSARSAIAARRGLARTARGWLLLVAIAVLAAWRPAQAEDGDIAALARVGYETDADDFDGLLMRGGLLWNYRSHLEYAGFAAQDTHYSQGRWSDDVAAVVGLYRKQDRVTLAGINAELGVADVSGHARPIGDVTWSVRPRETTGVELIAAGDVVGTKEAIERGITYGLFAGSVEQQFGSRLTGIALAGWQPFTDGNSRTQVRARLIYSLLPEEGLSFQFRWRQYWSSKRDVDGAYFNPEDYRNWDAGLSLRRRVGDWTVYGLAGGGQERVDRQTWQGTAIGELRAEGPVSGRARLAISVSYNRAAGFSDAPDYWYGAANVSLIVPF